LFYRSGKSKEDRISGGNVFMNSRLICSLAACLMLPVVVGCTASSSIIRGQNPTPTPDVVQEMPTYYNQSGQTFGPGGQMMNVSFPNGGGYQGNCPSGDCNFGCRGYGWKPHHQHTFRYDQPKLKYPQANQRPAVVQYPYYTVKGPSDFFYNGE